MAGKAVFDKVSTLATRTFFYLCLGKHGLEGVLLGWSLQNYPFGLFCLFHGPASHPHLSTTTNGCLWVIPGSQKGGFIMPREENKSDEYADVDTIDVSAYPAEAMIPLEANKGDVVFFNGYLLHSSLRNKTGDHFRTALVNHYMSAESMLPWDQDGKFTLTEDLRDIVMVAGTNPYAYKPIVDHNRPYLRPEVLKIKTNCSFKS
jgi:hypothetical protein